MKTRSWETFPFLAVAAPLWPWPLVPAFLALVVGAAAILLLLLYYYIIRVND